MSTLAEPVSFTMHSLAQLTTTQDLPRPGDDTREIPSPIATDERPSDASRPQRYMRLLHVQLAHMLSKDRLLRSNQLSSRKNTEQDTKAKLHPVEGGLKYAAESVPPPTMAKILQAESSQQCHNRQQRDAFETQIFCMALCNQKIRDC